MMTSSNGNIFRVTGPLCGEFPGPGELPAQRPVTRSFDVFFDLRLNKRLSKQPWDWWFETPAWSLWRHRNEIYLLSLRAQVGGLFVISWIFSGLLWLLSHILHCCFAGTGLSIIPQICHESSFNDIYLFVWHNHPYTNIKGFSYLFNHKSSIYCIYMKTPIVFPKLLTQRKLNICI